MRFISLIAALAALSACATTPLPASRAGASAPANAGAPSRAAQLLAAAGSSSAPTRAEIERALGAPDIARQDGAGAALTYRSQNCALLLVFVSDARNAMRLAQAHPSARRAGEASPSLDQCAAEAAQRRN